MPLETPTPDGVLELFRDEIVIREAEIDEAYREIASLMEVRRGTTPSPASRLWGCPRGRH